MYEFGDNVVIKCWTSDRAFCIVAHGLEFEPSPALSLPDDDDT